MKGVRPPREDAVARVRSTIRGLEILAGMIEDPSLNGEPLWDAIDIAEYVSDAMLHVPESRRMMRLVDAIGMYADSHLTGDALGRVGGGYGFEPAAFRAAVEAWRAPPTHGRGAGRTRTLWPVVAGALRSAGVAPPAPDSIRKEHERWRRARGRPARR